MGRCSAIEDQKDSGLKGGGGGELGGKKRRRFGKYGEVFCN